MNQQRRLPLALYAAAVGMEMCYLYVALDLLWQQLPLNYFSFWLLLALYPVSCFSRVAVMWRRIVRRSFVLTTVLGIAMVAAVAMVTIWQILAADYSILGAIVPIGFSGLAWWLGSSLIRDEVSYPYICTRFQIGILALLVLSASGNRAVIPTVIFFILAVFALSLARWESTVTDSVGILRPYQFGAMILGSAAVLLPSAFILLVLSPDVAEVIRRWLATLARILPVAPPPAGGAQQIWWDVSCSFKPAEEPMAPPSSPPSTDTPTSPIILWFILLVLLLAVLVLVPLTIRRLKAQRRTPPARVTGVVTTTVPLGLFRRLAAIIKRIGEWWRHWLLLMFRLKYSPRSVGEDEAVLSIRALYRSLLRWALKHNLPRLQSQTPWEYLSLLSQRFPQNGGELGLITEVYVKARYGRRPTTGQEFEVARKAWDKIINTVI